MSLRGILKFSATTYMLVNIIKYVIHLSLLISITITIETLAESYGQNMTSFFFNYVMIFKI